MSGCNTSNQKWSCEYCTYDNWPATKKCTLCRAPKPLRYICEDVQAPEQNIYKLAPLLTPTRPDAGGSAAGMPMTDTSNRWSCEVCTFLNWLTADKCVQCHSWHAPPAARRPPLSVNVSISAVTTPDTSPPRRISPRLSPKSPELTKSVNNDKNKVVVSATTAVTGVPPVKAAPAVGPPSKWSCRACTYDNWPRSVHCVVCGVNRGQSYSCHDDGNVATAAAADRKSPDKPPPPADSPTQNEGATACTPAGETSGGRERRVRRMTRGPRLHDADWLWLAACRGVVDGDPAAIDAYLEMSGDPARSLTRDECTLLARPSAYEAGHTLIHLAIRFRRDDLLTLLLAAADVGGGQARKRMPAHVSPGVATDILRGISDSLRQRKADFRCLFITEIATFSLPAGENLHHFNSEVLGR